MKNFSGREGAKHDSNTNAGIRPAKGKRGALALVVNGRKKKELTHLDKQWLGSHLSDSALKQNVLLPKTSLRSLKQLFELRF